MRRRAVVTISALFVVGIGLSAGAATPAWRVQATATPSGATGTALSGVSCPKNTTVCFAAGSFQTSTAQDTLVEKWTGSAWVHKSSPNPSGRRSWLYAITCRTASWCEAVGQEQVISSGAWQTLAEHWNGSAWSVQSTPTPTGGMYDQLASVSCPSTAYCIATGSYLASGNVPTVITDRWNGTNWSALSFTDPTGSTTANLNGVSCVSTTACFAVGNYESTGAQSLVFASEWNGSSWSTMSMPNPGTYTYRSLSGIACRSTSMCIATGERDMSTASTTTGYTLAERWNGTAWSVMTTPTPTGLAAANLESVSCPANNVCEAIGRRQSSSTNAVSGMAERWNGTSWALQTVPNPTNSHGTTPLSVSCVSTSVCEGVGNWKPTSTTAKALAERYS